MDSDVLGAVEPAADIDYPLLKFICAVFDSSLLN